MYIVKYISSIIVLSLYICTLVMWYCKMVLCQVATSCCLIRNRIPTEDEVQLEEMKNSLLSQTFICTYFYIVVYYIILLRAVKRVIHTGAGKHFGTVPGSPPSTFTYSCRWSGRRLPILHCRRRRLRNRRHRRLRWLFERGIGYALCGRDGEKIGRGHPGWPIADNQI